MKKKAFLVFLLSTCLHSSLLAMNNDGLVHLKLTKKQVKNRGILLEVVNERHTLKRRGDIAKEYGITKETLRKKIRLHNDGIYKYTQDIEKIPRDPSSFHHPEFIIHIIHLYLSNKMNVKQIQKMYQLGIGTIERWVYDYNKGKIVNLNNMISVPKRHEKMLTHTEIRNMLSDVFIESITGIFRSEIARKYGTDGQTLQKKIEEHNAGLYYPITQDIPTLPLCAPEHYDHHFAVDMLKLYFSRQKTKTQIREQYGLGYTTLNRWIKNFKRGTYDQEVLESDRKEDEKRLKQRI